MNYWAAPGLGELDTVGTNRAWRIVEKLTGVTLVEVQGRSRKPEIVFARALYAHLLRCERKLSISALATLIYGERTAVAKNNRRAAYNLLCTHGDMVITNPIYKNITKQAHVLYEGTTIKRPAEPQRLGQEDS